MDILRVLRERSTQPHHVSTSKPAATQLSCPVHSPPEKQQQLIDEDCCCTLKREESVQKLAADLFPRVVDLTCRTTDSSNERDVVITVLENPSGSWAAGNGSTLWDSAVALSGYLLKHQVSWLQGKRGLELGAGLALVSMALNAADIDIKMMVTERPLMLDLLRENCFFNSERKHESVYYQYQQRTMQSQKDTATTSKTVLPMAPVPVQQSLTTHANIPDKSPNLPFIHALTWGNNDDLHSIFRCIASSTSGPELLIHDDNHDIMMDQTPDLQSPLLYFVVLADVIFPSNRDCWMDLVDTLASVVSSYITISPSSSSSSSSELQPQSSLTTSSDVVSLIPPPPTQFLVGWLAYEPREDWVIVEFSSLLSDRGMHLHRVYDVDLIPEDIYVYELYYHPIIV